MLDTGTATEAWETARHSSARQGPSVWLHGDLQSGNLLVRQEPLSAVIDFGCPGIDDPASDLVIAWNLFSPEMRAVFRTALPIDDATWARGRGWAPSVRLIALPHYRSTKTALAGISRYAIEQAIADNEDGR